MHDLYNLVLSYVLWAAVFYAFFTLHVKGPHLFTAKRLNSSSSVDSGSLFIQFNTDELSYGWLGVSLVALSGIVIDVLFAGNVHG